MTSRTEHSFYALMSVLVCVAAFSAWQNGVPGSSDGAQKVWNIMFMIDFRMNCGYALGVVMFLACSNVIQAAHHSTSDS